MHEAQGEPHLQCWLLLFFFGYSCRPSTSAAHIAHLRKHPCLLLIQEVQKLQIANFKYLILFIFSHIKNSFDNNNLITFIKQAGYLLTTLRRFKALLHKLYDIGLTFSFSFDHQWLLFCFSVLYFSPYATPAGN